MVACGGCGTRASNVGMEVSSFLFSFSLSHVVRRAFQSIRWSVARATGHRAHCLVSPCSRSFPAPADPQILAAASCASAFMTTSTITP